jgi:hypothetical protein
MGGFILTLDDIITSDFVVATNIADIRSAPQRDAELVTQALMNTPAIAGETLGAWTHVTLSDYSGWILTDDLDLPIVRGICEEGDGTCGVALPYSVVVTATHAPIYAQAEGDEYIYDTYLSTALPYINLSHPQRIRVALPGDRDGWIPRECVDLRHNDALFPSQDISSMIAGARAFLDVPYLWGGISWQGIDCSGFVQLVYRMGGSIIPRDADQQHDFLPQVVAREEIQAGDLIFFGSKSITHVAMALNNQEYIHAEGQHYNRVVINSFDAQSSVYNERLDTIVWAIKRQDQN